MANAKVEKECARTNFANSTWFNGLVNTGSFYNPLTKTRGGEHPNSTKEFSVVSTEVGDLDDLEASKIRGD